jgi:hypothetical protein
MGIKENVDDHIFVIQQPDSISIFHYRSCLHRGFPMKIRHVLLALTAMVSIAGCELANMEILAYMDSLHQEYDDAEFTNDLQAKSARQTGRAVERWRWKTFTYTYTNFVTPASSYSYSDTYHYPYINRNWYDYRDRVYAYQTSQQRQERIKYYRDSRGRMIERRYYNTLNNPETRISWSTYSYTGTSSNYSQYTSLGQSNYIGYRYLYEYDEQGHMIEEKGYSKNDITPWYAYQWTYDVNGNLTMETYLDYEDDVTEIRYVTTTRDSNDRVVSERYYSDISKTDLDEEDTYSFDQAGNMISYSYCYYDDNEKLYEYSYEYTFESYNYY